MYGPSYLLVLTAEIRIQWQHKGFNDSFRRNAADKKIEQKTSNANVSLDSQCRYALSVHLFALRLFQLPKSFAPPLLDTKGTLCMLTTCRQVLVALIRAM